MKRLVIINLLTSYRKLSIVSELINFPKAMIITLFLNKFFHFERPKVRFKLKFVGNESGKIAELHILIPLTSS